MNTLLTSGVFLLVFAVTALASQTNPEETRSDFEAMAFVLPYLPLDPVLHGPAAEHTGPNFPEESETGDGILCRIAEETYRQEDLVTLLAHPNPKVRTLAAIALFERNDPSMLPKLVPLCSDLTPTFDGRGPLTPTLRTREVAPPDQAQTVGTVVTAMVTTYLRAAGFTHGVRPAHGPGFDEYWAGHRDRAYCAGWFAVQLDRAGHGLVLTPAACLAAIRAVRRRIDAAPADERAVILLGLRGQPGSDDLATDQEIVDAARALGRDRLLGLLRGHVPTDDPDVRPDGSDDRMFRRMRKFVLERAEDFFGSGDADDLLDCGRRPGNAGIAADCAVAAARLRPGDAAAILHAEMARFSDPRDSRQRAQLAVWLCRLGGPAEEPSVLAWFYQAQTDRGFELARVSFVEQVSEGAHGRETLAAIIEDYRFGSIGQEALVRVARAVNAWNAEPVVAGDELRKPHWESKDLEPEWVRKLRASIPRWVDDPAGEGSR